MLHWKSLVFVTAASAALAATTAVAPAQISINIGAAPVCPYGYYDYAPYDCAPYGYYGPDWFSGGVFIGAGHGFMAPTGSMATWITASIRVTAITGLSRTAAPSRSTIFMEMRHATARAISAMPAMTRVASMPADLSAVVILVAAILVAAIGKFVCGESSFVNQSCECIVKACHPGGPSLFRGR